MTSQQRHEERGEQEEHNRPGVDLSLGKVGRRWTEEMEPRLTQAVCPSSPMSGSHSEGVQCSPLCPSDDVTTRARGRLSRVSRVTGDCDKEERRSVQEEVELVRRMEDKVGRLEVRLREVRGRVVASEEEGKELGVRLGGRQGERLEQQGKELGTVTLLLLGLTGRLARLEVEGEKTDRKRQQRRCQLEVQVEEARTLRRSIDMRGLKVLSFPPS